MPSRCLESNCREKGGEKKTGKRLNTQVIFEHLATLIKRLTLLKRILHIKLIHQVLNLSSSATIPINKF